MGKPLLSYTLSAVYATGLDCPVYVSTDDDAIAEVATSFVGVQVVKRPPELASDTASTESVLLHVLDTVLTGKPPEWVMTLPPTSPFRTAETIRRFAEAVREDPESQDCLMSVTETRGDFWSRQGDGSLARLFPNAPRRQQEREPLFEENSAIYVTKVSALRETGVILGRQVHGIAISAVEGFDINTIEDLKMAECIATAMSRN